MLARIVEPFGRHPLLVFFVLAYAITWPGWWLEVAGSQFGALLGYFSPAIAAILVAATSSGREGLGELLARLFQWRVPLRWYLVTVLLPAGPVLVALALPVLAGNAAYHAEPDLLSPLLDFPFRLHILVLAVTAVLIVVVAEPEPSRTPGQSRPVSF